MNERLLRGPSAPYSAWCRCPSNRAIARSFMVWISRELKLDLPAA